MKFWKCRITAIFGYSATVKSSKFLPKLLPHAICHPIERIRGYSKNKKKQLDLKPTTICFRTVSRRSWEQIFWESLQFLLAFIGNVMEKASKKLKSTFFQKICPKCCFWTYLGPAFNCRLFRIAFSEENNVPSLESVLKPRWLLIINQKLSWWFDAFKI